MPFIECNCFFLLFFLFVFFPKGRVLRSAYRFQGVITTFEMILGGCPELNAIEWRCVIIDEAHRLKNKNCKLLEGFKLMNLVCIISH